MRTFIPSREINPPVLKRMRTQDIALELDPSKPLKVFTLLELLKRGRCQHITKLIYGEIVLFSIDIERTDYSEAVEEYDRIKVALRSGNYKIRDNGGVLGRELVPSILESVSRK